MLSDMVWVVLELNALLVIIVLIASERDPSTTLAWALALLLIPGVGLVLYLLFGRDWRASAKQDRERLAALARGYAAVEPLYDRYADEAARLLSGATPLVSRLSAAIERQCATRPLPCENLEVFTEGGRKFERLLDDILAARESIHLQYFIWEDDGLGTRVCDALAHKVAEGVEVRVLYDWVGSLPYSKRGLRRLRAAGATVRTDRPHVRWLNYRDHRKIVVVDGRIGYTGGMNVGQEYIDGGRRFASWRDTHCRFEGPLVAELQRSFATRWFRLSGEELFGTRYFSPLGVVRERAVWGQFAQSGPDSEWQALRNAFFIAITGAERRVRVQSPYFVPDESIMQALNAQALAGIDVRLMMAGIPDKRSAWYAAFSYLDDLVGAGGRVLQYTAGFFHPKTLTIDGRIAVIGTTNFDIRSFALHDEISLFLFDEQVARMMDDSFERDTAKCREIDAAFYERLSALARFRNACLRLLSRLL